jgi:hypothetical protein
MRTTFVLVAAMAVGRPGVALADDLDAAARGRTALCTDGKGRYLGSAD